MTISKLTTGAVVASLLAASALAHGGATGIVKTRMDGMSAMKDSMKVLTPIMQGAVPFDAAAVRSEAEKISLHAGEALTKLFPEGSDAKPSEARATIWTQWTEFSALAEQLQTYADGLALAADNGVLMAGAGQGAGMMSDSTMMMGGGTTMMDSSTMMGTGMMGAGMMGGAPDLEALSLMPADGVFTMLSQTCSACHTQFRVEKE